ncbi:uncharacterized protein LOC109863490, partial [Pseudomyrmex gracilis]|uniref:uncharacterized protein LOC109863490 n=1 Tax=Pseudomyrmex gracilis TaxID=219809 RepID=UPI000994CA9B
MAIRKPIYDSNRRYMNYATLGSILAYEINMVLIEKHISPFTKNFVFNNKKQCFIDTCRNLYPNNQMLCQGIIINQRLNHNMANAAGILVAYYAYKKKNPEQNEDNIYQKSIKNMTEDQKFFVDYARMMCEYIPLDKVELYIKEF